MNSGDNFGRSSARKFRINFKNNFRRNSRRKLYCNFRKKSQENSKRITETICRRNAGEIYRRNRGSLSWYFSQPKFFLVLFRISTTFSGYFFLGFLKEFLLQVIPDLFEESWFSRIVLQYQNIQIWMFCVVVFYQYDSKNFFEDAS